jgi:hypothetical protein
MQGFLRNLYLRPSCYVCNFKTLNRQSDITLADFWGVDNILPGFDDDKGTSLILINSEKGEKAFSSVADKVNYESVDTSQAVLYNPSAVKSVNYNPKRDKFFKELDASDDIAQLIIKYTKINLARKVYMKTRSLLSKMKNRIWVHM